MTISSFRSFRLVCQQDSLHLVEDLLNSQGFITEQEPFNPFIRRLVCEPFPLGSSLAAKFGLIYIQDRSSMLPPLVLAPPAGASVLDMCASPGSKTGFLAQLAGSNGFILGNEPSKNRLATLRRNLSSLNLLQTATIAYPGEQIPLPDYAEPCSLYAAEGTMTPYPGWNYIQLDPPCSGWGTVEKNPQVLSLWQGDKIQPLITLQRQLLKKAVRMLQPGGRLVYSTCTTNPEENEMQVEFACNELGLRLLPAPQLPGFAFAEAKTPQSEGTLRIETSSDGQGFFIALFEKVEHVFSDTHEPPITHQPTHTQTAGKNRKNQTRHNSTLTVNSHTRLIPQALEQELVDIRLLPAGSLEVFNGIIHFLPAASAMLLPEHFAWKGFPIGKLQTHGAAKVTPSLRALMPSLETAIKNGADILNIEEPAPLLKLLSGQSLTVSAKRQEMGLYYKGLPLCRLTVKGNRAVMPAL